MATQIIFIYQHFVHCTACYMPGTHHSVVLHVYDPST